MVSLPSIKFALIYISKNTSLRISVPCITRLNFSHFLFLKPCWILSFLKSTPTIVIPLSQNYWQSNLSIMNKKWAWRKVYHLGFFFSFCVLLVSFLTTNSLPPLPEILHANASENNLENRVCSFGFGTFLSQALLASTVYTIIIVVRCCQQPCLVSQIALTAFQASLRIAQDSDVWWWVESCHYNGSSAPVDLYQESQTCYTGESPLAVWGGRGGQGAVEVLILCSFYPLTLSNIEHRYHLKPVIRALFIHSEQADYL